MNSLPWLSILTALPLAGAVVLLLLRNLQERARAIALFFSSASLLLALGFALHFDKLTAAMQFEERLAWIPSLAVNYHLGIDGLGLTMLLLTALVTTMAISASWNQHDRPAPYFALMLALESCLFGAFTALNFVHWFTFWELSLVPAYFLIKLWGGPKRSAAAMQFLVYTMAGGIAMLLGFVALYLSAHSFEFSELSALAQSGRLNAPLKLAFCGVLLGLAVKVPMWPVHTWLPDAYTEAPSSTTMLLTGVMSKMGLYGFLRILLPIFGAQMQHFLKPLLWLALASIIFSAFSALAQRDIKRLFAYSSINHLGYCLLAIFACAQSGDPTNHAAALDGAMLQMFNHGFTAALLFWFVALIEDRTGGLRSLDDFGGLRRIAPIFAGLMGIAIFSSLGLPGLNGFIGEFLLLKGTFALAPWAAAVSLIGLMITAVFLLTLIQRVFTGALNERWSAFPDLTRAQRIALAPVIALLFLLGLCPQVLLQFLNPTATQMAQQIRF